MKRLSLLMLMCSVLLVLPARAQIESNDINIGAEAFYAVSDDDTVQGYMLTAPFVSHYLEILFYESLTGSIDSGLGFFLSKAEADEEAWDSFDLYSEAEVEYALSDMLSITPALAFYFSNYKWDEDTRENWMNVNVSLTGSFSTMEEDLAGISLWEQFQRGLTLDAAFFQELYFKDAGEKADELDRAVGVEAEYSYFNEGAAFMLTPSFALLKHLNDAVSESLELNGAVSVAKDLSTILTGEAILDLFMEKLDADADMESELILGAAVHLNAIEKLEITGSAEYAKNLSDDEADPVFGFGLAFEYELFSY